MGAFILLGELKWSEKCTLSDVICTTTSVWWSRAAKKSFTQTLNSELISITALFRVNMLFWVSPLTPAGSGSSILTLSRLTKCHTRIDGGCGWGWKKVISALCGMFLWWVNRSIPKKSYSETRANLSHKITFAVLHPKLPGSRATSTPWRHSHSPVPECSVVRTSASLQQFERFIFRYIHCSIYLAIPTSVSHSSTSYSCWQWRGHHYVCLWIITFIIILRRKYPRGKRVGRGV